MTSPPERAEWTEQEPDRGLLSLVFDAVADVIALVAIEPGPRFRWVKANRAAREVVGGGQELVGRYVDELLGAGVATRLAERYAQVRAAGGAAVRYQIRASLPTGLRTFEATLSPLCDASGCCTHLLWTGQDVTERCLAEERLTRSEARFRSLVQNSFNIVVVLDAKGTIRYVTPSLSRHLGDRPEEVLGRKCYDFVHPDEVAGAVETIAELVSEPGVHPSRELRIRHRDGSWRWLEFTSDNLLEDPDVAGIVVELRDATERVRDEGRIRLQARLLDEVPAAVVLTDLHHVVRLWNRQAEILYGWSREEALGRPIRELSGGLRESVALVEGTNPGAASVLSGERWEGEFLARRKDGSVVTTYANLLRVCEPEDGFVGIVGVSTDITERKLAEAELAHQALHDPLTGLPNRALLLDRLDQALARSRRRRPEIAILFFDVDHFKLVNDGLGHEAGDEALVTVARRVRAVLRPQDTVARFGGDEFVVLAEGVADEAAAVGISDRIAGAFAEPYRLGDQEVTLSTSVGIALARSLASRPEDLLREADEAMYQAKKRGRARHAVFDEAMLARTKRRVSLEAALRRAVEYQEFRLLYQPVVDTASRRMAGAEALLRWHRQEEGPESGILVPPGQFLPLAEQTGLMVPIGAWVLAEACRQAAHWQPVASVPGAPPFTVAVNLGARQLFSADLVELLRRALDEAGSDPTAILLEVGEAVLMDDPETSLQSLGALRALGVRIRVDDFGTGWSSLSYLHRLPLDALKIDRRFVHGLETDEGECRAVVSGVVSLAHGMGLQAVAEGVETAAQLRQLEAMGCELVQGFYFSPPQPPEALEDLLGPDGRRGEVIGPGGWTPPS